MSTKVKLRREIESTQKAYHSLLAEIPEEAYGDPSDNPAWTIGEVLYHMSLAPRFMTADVRMIIRQAWVSKLIGLLIPKRIFDRLNEHFTRRWASRNMTREKLLRAYDNAHENTLRALESLREEDFGKSLEYPNYDELLQGVVSVERLFRYIKVHFDSHAGQIRKLIKDGK